MTKTLAILALVAFLLAASAGIYLTVQHFLRKKLPVSVALAHGLGGAIGFTLVLVAVVKNPTYIYTRQALYIFIVAIGLGAFNLLFHVRKKRHRTSLIFLHALTAVSGVLTLLYGVVTYTGPVAVAASQKPSKTVVAPPPEPVQEPIPPPPVPIAVSAPAVNTVSGIQIYFGPNGTAILSESVADLNKVSQALHSDPNLTLTVEGHTDTTGSAARNDVLAFERSRVVVLALKALGIRENRLLGYHFASRCPTGDLRTSRRVTFRPIPTTPVTQEIPCP